MAIYLKNEIAESRWFKIGSWVAQTIIWAPPAIIASAGLLATVKLAFDLCGVSIWPIYSNTATCICVITVGAVCIPLWKETGDIRDKFLIKVAGFFRWGDPDMEIFNATRGYREHKQKVTS
jgi:hypothetical protein